MPIYFKTSGIGETAVTDTLPAKRGKGRARKENEDKTSEQRHQAMIWAQRLKRVFNIDVSVLYGTATDG